MQSSRWRVVVGCVLALAGCAGAPEQSATPRPTIDPLGPLTALPECPSPPAGRPEKVEGLALPEGFVVTAVQAQDPLTTVQALVPLTPAQFEADYAGRDDLDVLITENEIYEAELLVSDGSHRNFLKATATCSTGSQVLAVVAPEVDAEGLPVPQGAATATPAPAP
jgi:hypothetical protein